MSLVSTYVYAIDGLIYRDPIIVGDGWFICFNDDDPVELVVFEGVQIPSLDYIRLLEKAKPRRSYRCVPPEWQKMKSARSYWCRLVKRIPVPQLHEGIVNRGDIWQGVLFGEDLS